MTTRTLSVLRTHDHHEIPVAGEYAIDPAHTSVEFIGRHLMITKVRGRFPGMSGTITIADEPERSHVEVELQVASVDTGNPGPRRLSPRRRLLRRRHVSDHHLPLHQGRARFLRYVGGDRRLHGPRRHPSGHAADVDFGGANASPYGDERIAFSAATDVDREDWGLTWNVALETGGILVGKKVRIELNVQAVASARP